jgi:hypothetical protein
LVNWSFHRIGGMHSNLFQASRSTKVVLEVIIK